MGKLDQILNLIQKEEAPELSLDFDRKFFESVKAPSWRRNLPYLGIIWRPRFAAAFSAACVLAALFLWAPTSSIKEGTTPVPNSLELVNTAILRGQNTVLRMQVETQARDILSLLL